MSNQTITPQILIRHVSGSKKGKTETFQATDEITIRIGRGPDNEVSYDPVMEDVVSRNHSVIRRIKEQPDAYEIVDSQSRNGTFVNGQRVPGKSIISIGDVVQLGKDGPSFEFDLNPRPIQKTRVLDTSNILASDTKIQNVTSGQTSQKEIQKEAVGKETMLHMLQESENKSKKGLLITIIAILILIGTGAWIFFSRPVPQPKIIQINKGNTNTSTDALTPAQIAKYNNNKVVFIEAGWKLVYTPTGEDIFHVYMPKKESPTGYLAAYIRNEGKIEPYLVTKSYAPRGANLVPIGGNLNGSGFVVDERGFIITNRHVAESWNTNFQFPQIAFPGLLYELNAKGSLVSNDKASVLEADVANWVPAEAMNYNRKVLSTGVKLIDGETTYMEVTFANNNLRTHAKTLRVSNVHDVAMIKIDLPETLTKVTMSDNNDIETGMPVTVLGYPAMSPKQYVATQSNDAFNRNPNIASVPVPTLSTGYIGRLVKAQDNSGKADAYLSMMGDYYQLTINSTGPGNSGGPLYDERGQVIGIFSAGNANISFAIPIKYAVELMGTKQVIK